MKGLDSEAPKASSLFSLCYVNQPRLVDIFAIMNDGLTEYEEIEESSSFGSKSSASAKVKVGPGFRLMKVGASAEAGLEDNERNSASVKGRRVQTVPSMLKIVLDQLEKGCFIKGVAEASEGDFVRIPADFKINSLKSLVNEAVSLVELGDKMKGVGAAEESSKNQGSVKQLRAIANVVKDLFGAEEIVSQEEKYAVVGTISDQYLYQASRRDIVDINLTCFGQVRRIYPNGTQLMKNTVFTKMQDPAAKESFIEGMAKLVEGQSFAFDSTAIVEITDRPVYQLDVIALFQEAHGDSAEDK